MNIKKINCMLLPIMFVLLVVPLAMQISIVTIGENTLMFYQDVEQVDIYIYSKSACLMFGCVLMIIFAVLMLNLEIKNFKKDMLVYFICSFIFVIFTLISSFLAIDREVAFHGFFMNGEGFYNLACYMIVFIYTILNFTRINDFRYLAYPLVIVVIINTILGLMQYTSNDILSTDFGANLITPTKYDYLIENIKIAHETFSTYMYGTLYHYNYMGTFCSMVIPFFTILFFTDNNKINKFIFLVTAILGCLLLFGSNARSGIAGIAGVLIFSFLLFFKQLLKNWKISISAIIIVVIIAVVSNIVAGGTLFARVPTLFEDIKSIFVSDRNFDFTEHIPIKDVILDDNIATLNINGNMLILEYKSGILSFFDENDNILDVSSSNNSYSINKSEFSGYTFKMYSSKYDEYRNTIVTNYYNSPVLLFNADLDGNISVASPQSGHSVEMDRPESWGFQGNEQLGSARGYIWSRSFPLIKNNLIFGAGPDNYIFEFPQHDYFGKQFAYGTYNMVISKPHNLFLQILINNGGVAFLAFMTIITKYIFDCLKLYGFKQNLSKMNASGVAIFLAVIGYLFTGIFNDSLVLTSPIFWILLGGGVSTNIINKERFKNSKNFNS